MSHTFGTPLTADPVDPSGAWGERTTGDAMEVYFECITTCSLEDGECVTRCVEELRQNG